jgi:cell division protein FtsL
MEILIVFFAVAFIIVLLSNLKKGKILTQLKEDILENEKKLNQLIDDNSTLQNKVAELSQYQIIVDVNKEVSIILENANDSASKILNEANQSLELAQKNALETKKKIEILVNDNELKISRLYSEAEINSAKIILDANIKAEKIAGDAYWAFQNASQLEQSIKAMKNVIEGYGDKYLIPTYSLLDDLAAEFGHVEAGEKLKSARLNTKRMVENSTGANCDYVETTRKETAIRFVIDAFNGKVDSILSKVKKDNYGTLQQMIKDAFQIVNTNGQAFRNARINERFLESRLDELKWAVIAQELKWQEQEEQRRIKEQIREEEKARREYEKAIRETQKEEETLKKLIEKAQEEVAKSNAEQKAKFELQLIDLKNKLEIAEERNKRALSMAQQTRSGNVYIISNIGSFGEDVFKIGMTRRLEPLDRIKELGDASVPFEFDVHSMIYSDDAPSLERQLHKVFLKMQMNKVNPRKEFFRVTLSDIKNEIENLGINPKWTLAAEAKQYRETLALENAMKNDKDLQNNWVESQLLIPDEQIDDVEEQVS